MPKSNRAVTREHELSNILSIIDKTVLDMISSGAPFPDVLNVLTRIIEEQSPGLLCSILLLDPNAKVLRHGAAPSLPDSYNRAINGMAIGPSAGSCGTAAFRGQPVVVPDIANDPLWSDYRELGLSHGLRACWSTPIVSREGKVLGTFAIYYREPREPSQYDWKIIERATHLAAIIIERKRREEQLRTAETKFRTLVEQLPTITYIAEFGEAGRWSYVSPQIESLLGFSPEEWMADSRSWANRLHPDDREHVLAEEARSRDGSEPFRSEYRMIARDGRVLWFRDEATVVQGHAGEPSFMQGVLYDITERKQLEDQLRQAQKMEAVGRLAGGVAHDFNNLLMVIKGRTELMTKGLAPTEPLRRSVDEIAKAADQAATLTQQLLAFSRMQMLQPKVLNLNTVVDEMGRMLPRLIGEDIELIVMLSELPCLVKSDQSQIEQVILNLAVNARDAMPRGGKLQIQTANVDLDEAYARRHTGVRPGKYVMLAVEDTGVGMDAETQARIFEPFFTTKGLGKGTGLGLATVYGVVKQSGGWIWVYSEPGQGTTFKIYLPQVEEVDEPLDESAAVRATTARGTETILVVEDQESIRELAREFLESRGYTVLEARDGGEALQVAEQHPGAIDLLVTDVVMPKMGGRELVYRLMARRPQMKALFMSGYVDKGLTEPGAGGQLVICLQKPFSLDSLARKVREVLDAESKVRVPQN